MNLSNVTPSDFTCTDLKMNTEWSESHVCSVPWSWGLGVFVEQLCLVDCQQVSRQDTINAEGGLCHSPLSFHPSSISTFFLFSYTFDIHWLQTKQANKQNNRKKTINQTRLGWAGGWDGERSCLLCRPVPFHCDGSGGLPGHGYTHTCVWLPRRGIKADLCPYWHIIFWSNGLPAAATSL